jgi:mannose-6-phosphate isomerase-like protein (cupin superfamily)
MDELKKGLKLSIGGAARKQALAAFARQMKRWGLTMPKVQPLVVDFGLGDFYKTGETEFWIANEAKAGYCGKFLFVFDGQTCPLHRHRTKHETFFIMKGKVRMKFGRGTRVMKEGDVLVVPSWRPHSFTGVGPALLLEISMPCDVSDNYFADRRIPFGGNYRAG